jgi:hypothetical protein
LGDGMNGLFNSLQQRCGVIGSAGRRSVLRICNDSMPHTKSLCANSKPTRDTPPRFQSRGKSICIDEMALVHRSDNLKILHYKPRAEMAATLSTPSSLPTAMDLSDASSSTGSSPPPMHKAGAKRGRPRLTEDAELAKLVLSDH